MKKKIYLAGDIMGFGSNLARQYEYDQFCESGIDLDVYSPVMNKSINDKANMTEEENNHLAEKITKADVDRMWDSDIVVAEPRQDAIGTLCETGCLYGWDYMANRLLDIVDDAEDGQTAEETLNQVVAELRRIAYKDTYFHYFDIRTNHLNEKDWRRSFSINQLLYGMILADSTDVKLYNSFDEVLRRLKERYGAEGDGGPANE